ncbi:hypothetical protein Dimus_015019 [Dionaea muscipula]
MSSRFCRRRSSEYYCLFIRAIVLGCFLLLFVVDSVSSRQTREKIAAVTTTDNIDTTTREKIIAAQPIMDINYLSKRRVPNGPDPIHNRRAGNSKQPPGKA